MKNLKDFDFKNKRVLVRCDFQVSLDEKGNILNDLKIRETVPTINYLAERKAKVILMSHWKPMESGRKAESLKLILPRITELVEKEINFLDDCLGEETEREVKKMRPGEIVLLENLRAHKEEEENSDIFARQLASLGEIYVNDAFGVSHRPHASLVGLPKYLPSAAGFLLEKEVSALKKIMENPENPLIVIIGGLKVKTKAKAINRFSEKADSILVGDLIKQEIKKEDIGLKNAQKIVFPIDGINSFDISDETINLFKEKIKSAKTVFWTGPLGKVEEEEFQKGTIAVALAIIESGAYSVVGGGETVWFLEKAGLIKKFSHVSTGGGAMLEFLSGERLPGLEALK